MQHVSAANTGGINTHTVRTSKPKLTASSRWYATAAEPEAHHRWIFQTEQIHGGPMGVVPHNPEMEER